MAGSSMKNIWYKIKSIWRRFKKKSYNTVLLVLSGPWVILKKEGYEEKTPIKYHPYYHGLQVSVIVKVKKLYTILKGYFVHWTGCLRFAIVLFKYQNLWPVLSYVILQHAFIYTLLPN